MYLKQKNSGYKQYFCWRSSIANRHTGCFVRWREAFFLAHDLLCSKCMPPPALPATLWKDEQSRVLAVKSLQPLALSSLISTNRFIYKKLEKWYRGKVLALHTACPDSIHDTIGGPCAPEVTSEQVTKSKIPEHSQVWPQKRKCKNQFLYQQFICRLVFTLNNRWNNTKNKLHLPILAWKMI